ncbi:MAG: hypothetical protein HY744_02335 [Deltaproteobacteria bacterium]|nr:hypothetical protein [Deltaproteobacteria bacterium]
MSPNKRVLLAASLCLAALAAGALAWTRGSAARPPAAAKRASGPHLVLGVPWGAIGAALGRKDASEAAPEGPMSFALLPDGDVVVLDQVNLRLARLRGPGFLVGETPIPADTFQELEVREDGTVVLLDRLARASLLVMAPSGAVLREVGIVGAGIPEGGAVTAMLAEPDGIWLEHNNTDRVRLLDAQLVPTARAVVRGRALGSDKRLLAALDGRAGATLWLEDATSGLVLKRVAVPAPQRVDRIIWVQADSRGDVHALFHLLASDPALGAQVATEEVLGLRYDGALDLVATYRSPYTIRIWEQFREVRVLPDGTVYQMAFTDEGVRILRWSW